MRQLGELLLDQVCVGSGGGHHDPLRSARQREHAVVGGLQ